MASRDGKLIWGRLTHSRVIGMLANPTYAGTYAFGRFQSCKHIFPNGEIHTQVRRVRDPNSRHQRMIDGSFDARCKHAIPERRSDTEITFVVPIMMHGML
jgi:hypothetical protein